MNRELAFILLGWSLFIVSAAFFIASAWRAGDMLALAGGIAFLLANFAFLFALLLDRRMR